MLKAKMTTLLCTACALIVVPFFADASASGTNASRVKVKVYTKQGSDWFRGLTQRTDRNGVLKLKNVLPGWYEFVINDDDVQASQTLGFKLRMLDENGKRIREKTTVNLYIDVSGTKVFVSAAETDEDGWLEASGFSAETKYYLEVDGDGKVSKKDNMARIKVKAKVDDSDWFRAFYGRTDENMILELENVLPAKYKFSYKGDERAVTDPFTLHIRVLDEKGKRIKEPTVVTCYAYVFLNGVKTRVPAFQGMTDSKGWITIPGVLTKMTYKLKVGE